MVAGRDVVFDPGPAGWRSVAAVAVAATAWLAILVLEVTGGAAALHHHALLDAGQPPLVAAGLFSVSWTVMVVAMMVPASLPAIARSASLGWVVAFALAWAGVGLVGFAGDGLLHRAVDAWPWLAERTWVIQVGILGAAGLYQLGPIKRRFLDRCRMATHETPDRWPPDRWSSFAAGWRHGLDCIGSSGALMLLMFAEGLASLVPMVLLTGLMVYEANGRHGIGVAKLAGVALVLMAIDVAVGPGIATS
jgi:predicted metal-binding membrane protein